MAFASRLLGRSALAPAGRVATVASLSMVFSGERSVALHSPQVAGRVGEAATRSLFYRPRHFSTARRLSTSSTSATTKATPSPAAATTTTTPTKNSGSFVAWYEGHLEARPVVTKMLTGSLLWGIGDAAAQLVPQLAAAKDEKQESTEFEYDFPRSGRAVLFGFAIHAPTSHVHFNFLEWLTHKVGVTGMGIPVFKTVMEQFVYWGWISNGMYLAAMGAMQGHSPEKIYNKIYDSMWGLMQAQWAFWIPVQLLNFQFVPVRHQLNVVLITSIVWTALLSFWYPPEAKSEEEDTATVTAPIMADSAAKTDQK